MQSSRRRFAFLFGLGLFGLSRKLNARVLDDWAATGMHLTKVRTDYERAPQPSERQLKAFHRAAGEHWTFRENKSWRWFERETFDGKQWHLTGVTTPHHRVTNEPYVGQDGYIDEMLVPADMRQRHTVRLVGLNNNHSSAETEGDQPGQPSAERRARHGRPPSKWLRSLSASELSQWLATVEVPEAGVSGMTFWIHLTRDHQFDAANLEGLTLAEFEKLHSAAHHGY
ncbi:MAG: hypothetical protein Aurels2KO_49080 [Aureliella sp.]